MHTDTHEIFTHTHKDTHIHTLDTHTYIHIDIHTYHAWLLLFVTATIKGPCIDVFIFLDLTISFLN